ETIFLGETDGCPLFGLNLDKPPAGDGAVAPTELRDVGALLDADEASLLAWFRALIHWHRGHRYCPCCGQPTVPEAAGHERVCRACGTRQFPRVDPAIIVLVEYGERCLLGARHNWSKGRYSTLAGFVEPGESPEDAVGREVFE